MITSNKWSCEVVLVTPSMAEATLQASNYDNRKIRKTVVARYAKIMIDGGWKLTPEPIIMSNTERLLNGQHRLSAVVASGVACRFMVIRGVPDDVFSALDRGVARTTSDALHIDKKTVECARVILSLGLYRGLITDDEVARMVEIIRPSAEKLFDYCGTATRVFSSAPYRAAAILRMMKDSNPQYVMDVYRNLVLSHVSELPSVAQALIGVLAKDPERFSGGGSRQSVHLATAWNIFDIRKSNMVRVPANGAIDKAIADVSRYVDGLVTCHAKAAA